MSAWTGLGDRVRRFGVWMEATSSGYQLSRQTPTRLRPGDESGLVLGIVPTFPSKDSSMGNMLARMDGVMDGARHGSSPRYPRHSAESASKRYPFEHIHDGCLLSVSCPRAGRHQGCCRFQVRNS